MTAPAAKLCVTNTRSHITHRDVVLLNIMSAARNEINVNRLEITEDEDDDDKHYQQYYIQDGSPSTLSPFIAYIRYTLFMVYIFPCTRVFVIKNL